jgi:hypothetical protein
MIGVAYPKPDHGGQVDADLDTFVTALYVTIDDALRMRPELAPWRPRVGLAPKVSDAELVTLAVLQALWGFTSETRFLRHASAHLRPWFPYIPMQSGYNKRLRKSAAQLKALLRLLAADTEYFDDDTWVIDSTPLECGRSRPTVERSDLAGWASYGYCASHSRFFWGLRLHLVCTPVGLPITFALADPKLDEREVARHLLEAEPGLLRPGQTILADKGYRSKEFETFLSGHGLTLLRPAHKRDRGRVTSPLLKPLRQLIESVNATLKVQLDLERHGGRTPGGVTVRVLQRLLALTAVIWHNAKSAQRPLRSLVAFDHG